MNLECKTIGFAMTGSFCSFSHALDQLQKLKNEGFKIIPIMSETSYTTDTRFGKSCDFINEIERICENKIIHTIADAEPIGPKKLLDLLIVCPCTGNTMAKLANAITDTSVTMAAKAHMRNDRAVLICPATNDALGSSGKNIMSLMNTKNIYFAPFGEDDPEKKPKSLVCHWDLVVPAAKSALEGKQIQPVIF